MFNVLLRDVSISFHKMPNLALSLPKAHLTTIRAEDKR